MQLRAHFSRLLVLPSLLAAFWSLGLLAAPAAQGSKSHVSNVRLYAFDLGNVPISDSTLLFSESVPLSPGSCCIAVGYLIVHPRGTLMWDTGVVPDADLDKPVPSRGRMVVEAPKRSLASQLLEIGYRPTDITYLGLSHMHFDHIANANAFANATWLVQDPERAAMFQATASQGADFRNYSALKTSKTIDLISVDSYDVFGDGTVVVMAAPGHTPGHQVLAVKLRKTGPVVLAGDLYHFREERTLRIVPRIDFNQGQTRASREAIEAYVKKTGSQLWIEHDTRLFNSLPHSPKYIE